MKALGDRAPAITGLGLVTPLGFGVETSWRALLEGRSGIRDLEGPGAPPGMRLGALVEPPYLRIPVPEELQGQAKFLNGSGEMAATAVAEALAGAHFAEAGVPGDRRGFWLAQGDNQRADCLDFRPGVVEAWHEGRPVGAEALNRASMSKVKPWYLLETLLNNAFSLLSAWWDLRGANTSLSGFPGSGMSALELGAEAVLRGACDLGLVAGAARTSGPTVRREMADLGLATKGADGPASYRPLDRRRDGTAPGEGAAALVLEPLAAARARGARVHAVVAGSASAFGRPAPGAFGPPADALADAAGRALAEAGVGAGDLVGLLLPGLGTRGADAAALEAASRVLAGAPVPVAAWKGATGLSTCASDLMEAVWAVRALEEGCFPGTCGFGEPEPAHAGLRVSADPARRAGRAVLVLAGGLGGQASAVCLARP